MHDSFDGESDLLVWPEDKDNAWTDCGDEALIDAAQALARLLGRAEGKGARRSKRIAQFFAAVGDSAIVVWPPRDMQADDLTINDDMLLCLNALRWHRPSLIALIPDGDRRIWQVISDWGSSGAYPVDS